MATKSNTVCLPSSSIIVVTAWWGSPKRTKLGGLIVKLKLSKDSNVLLSNIDILNDFTVSPAVNKTLYGPGS